MHKTTTSELRLNNDDKSPIIKAFSITFPLMKLSIRSRLLVCLWNGRFSSLSRRRETRRRHKCLTWTPTLQTEQSSVKIRTCVLSLMENLVVEIPENRLSSHKRINGNGWRHDDSKCDELIGCLVTENWVFSLEMWPRLDVAFWINTSTTGSKNVICILSVQAVESGFQSPRSNLFNKKSLCVNLKKWILF